MHHFPMFLIVFDHANAYQCISLVEIHSILYIFSGLIFGGVSTVIIIGIYLSKTHPSSEAIPFTDTSFHQIYYKGDEKKCLMVSYQLDIFMNYSDALAFCIKTVKCCNQTLIYFFNV